MARTQHTYAKRQRELLKKRKAEEKRDRRRLKKEDGGGPQIIAQPAEDFGEEVVAEASDVDNASDETTTETT